VSSIGAHAGQPPRQRSVAKGILFVYMGLVIAFIFMPIAAMVAFSFNDSGIPSLPWEGFTFRWYEEFANDAALVEGLQNSILLASMVSVISTSIALVTVYFLRRTRWRQKELLTAWVTAPALIPLLMAGLAIFTFFDLVGWTGSRIALACGLSTIGIPFGMAVIRSQLTGVDPAPEEAAINLGASHWTVLTRIVVPQCWSGIAGALLLTFVVGWDEFAISWFVTQFETTLPVQTYEQLGSAFSPKINAVGTIVFFTSLCLTVGAYLVALRPALRRAGR